MPASIEWSGRSCRLFSVGWFSLLRSTSFLTLSPSFERSARVRLVLVRPPLLPACRIVRVRILRIPACQRYRNHRVVMRPFPPHGVLLVAGERYLHLRSE